MPAASRDSRTAWLGDGSQEYAGASRTSGHPRQTQAIAAYPALASGGGLSAYAAQKSGYGNTLGGGGLGPYSIPGAPAYPSMTASYRPLPPMRPLETLARRGRPRWGLRFLMLLIVAGGGMYFLRPYISWVDGRVSQVEQAVKQVASNYGLDTVVRAIGARTGHPAPVPPSAPVAVERAPAPPPAAARPAPAARAIAGPGARPDIQPLSPRASRGTGGPAPGARAMVPGPRAGSLAARTAAIKPGLTAARPGRAVASPRGRSYAARVAAWRRRVALGQARRQQRLAQMPSDEEITSAAPAAAAVAAAPVAAARPAAAPAAPAEEAPAAKAPVAAPVPKGPPPRTTATLVKEAAGSGDELDRLMAGAVTEKTPAPARKGDRTIAEIDRKIADVTSGQSAGPRLRPAAAATSSAPPLSTSDIKTVMAGVQKQMNTCFRMHGKAGPADVKVEVAPDGAVAGTLIKGEFAGTPTGACVESKIKAATFPASSGLRFDYRLSVR
jgi:hypothetical protein